MKERPILFSAPMVRAILEGRKKQTRRVSGLEVINKEPHRYEFKSIIDFAGKPHASFWDHIANVQVIAPLKHGKPGDRLWVRETHSQKDVRQDGGELRCLVGYQADETARLWDMGGDFETAAFEKPKRWKPSIFMPRWASRLSLEITGVRVERLQDISEEDAWAEGCERGEPTDNGGWFPKERQDKIGATGWDCARDWYADLWDEINSPCSWDANPFAWVIEFKKILTLTPAKHACTFPFHCRSVVWRGL